MPDRLELRTLVYKRTHSGDPDPATGVFGNNDCMGQVRRWPFDAVIGVGGLGPEAERNQIAGKITWIGIGPHRRQAGSGRGPLVSFDHFLYYGEKGDALRKIAPRLSEHIYDGRVRATMECLSPEEASEVARLLKRAADAPPSGQVAGENTRQKGKSASRCRSSHQANSSSTPTKVPDQTPSRRCCK